MKKRKICIVTGTRAEYGLLYLLMKSIKLDSALELQIIATGTHLSPEFGLTFKEIENDGFKINRKIEMILSSDNSSSISKSTALGLIGFGDAFIDLNPDIIICVGDRFEIFSACLAALYQKIVIAHIHGGETTVGAYDEAIRHSITKMSWFHFVANDIYKKRVIQLGENPERVFNVGGLGVDAILRTKLLSKSKLENITGIKFSKKNLLITFHPVTLEANTSKRNFQSLLDALNDINDIYLIFTMPNADSDSRIIKRMIQAFVSENSKRSISFKSMGRINYLSTMQFVDGVIGNSSSGIMEAPTFNTGTINIGDRQKGRIQASSIINCKPTKSLITKAINSLYSKEYKATLSSIINPYGKGDASKKIIEILRDIKLPEELKKEFYDL